MKQIFLTLFFATYYFFMPFVMVNCGSAADAPYSLQADSGATADEVLAECKSMQYLVDSCVDVLAAENQRIDTEKATVAAAGLVLDDFVTCESQETIDTTTTSSTATSDTATSIDCSTTITNVVSAYQLCTPLTASEKYDGCDDIETTMEDAVDACDTNSSTVTTDFCSSLTA